MIENEAEDPPVDAARVSARARFTRFFTSRFSMGDSVLWRVMRLLGPLKRQILLANLYLVLGSAISSVVLVSLQLLFNFAGPPPPSASKGKVESVLEQPAPDSPVPASGISKKSKPGAFSKLLAPVSEKVPALRAAGNWISAREAGFSAWARASVRRFILSYAGFILFLLLLQGCLQYLGDYGMSRVGIAVMSDLMRRTFGNVLEQDMQFFDNRPTGDLLKTCYQEIFRMQPIVLLLASTRVRLPIDMLILFCALLFISVPLSLLLLVMLPVVILPTMLLTRRLRASLKQELHDEAGPLVVMSNSFHGIRAIKAFGAEALERRYMEPNIANYVENSSKRRRAQALIEPMVDILNMVVLLVLFVGAALLFPQSLQVGAGTLALFAFAVTQFYKPFRGLMTMNIKMQQAVRVSQRVFDLLDHRPEIVDRPGAGDFPAQWRYLVFADVSLTYAVKIGGREKFRQALAGVDLKLYRGELVALMGRNGAGKSSVVNLVCRLYHPTKGSIRIDDTPIKDIRLKSLREKVCLITQSPILFDRTVAENIAFGLEGVSRERIVAAAQAARCHAFIEELPDGYDTEVGEGGRLLSGGEKQKIALARAFVREPEILILDEPTTGLDQESAREFLELVTAMRGSNKLVIYITHQQSEMHLFDRVLVLDKKQRIRELPRPAGAEARR